MSADGVMELKIASVQVTRYIISINFTQEQTALIRNTIAIMIKLATFFYLYNCRSNF